MIINKVSPPEMDECLLRVLRMFVHHQLVQRFYRKPNFQLDTTIYKSSLLIASARALLTRRKCKYASRNVLYSISMSKLKNSKKYNRPNIETLQPPSASDTGHRGKPRYQQLDNITTDMVCLLSRQRPVLSHSVVMHQASCVEK